MTMIMEIILITILVNLRLFCVRNKLTCVTEYISEYQINARDAQSECWWRLSEDTG